MSSTLDTMPIFTATGGISSNTASICAASISGGVFVTMVTPVVFCAVSAAMAVMPAPPEESDPAMLNTGAKVLVMNDSLLAFACL